MAGFVWRRGHTIVAAATAAVLVGVGAAIAVGGHDDQAAPVPVVAPSVTGSPSATASLTPTPTPSTPAPGVDPLTGGKPSGAKVLAVKVENIAAARPQIGLNAADIVFVEEVEGSLTRLVAVYHSRFPRRVGPVRSARNTDVELLPMFGRPGLVYSGANRDVQRHLDDSAVVPLQRSDRDRSRVAPHNVFVDLAAVADQARKVGPARDIGWTFDDKDPRWARAPRDQDATARVGGDAWSFRRTGDSYVVRWNGKTYADGRSGKLATADNVVVMSVKNSADGNADVNGARSVKSATVGSGRVTIYRDGRKLSGRWKRAGTGKPMQFVDADATDLPLRPGTTWVLLRG